MIAVLDSNAALEVVLKREHASLFSEALASADKTVTSELYRIEVVNALWKYYRAKYINAAEAKRLLILSEGLVDEFVPIADYTIEALSESLRLDHPAYDMLYLTLARRFGAVLLTLDNRLRGLAKGEGIPVIPA